MEKPWTSETGIEIAVRTTDQTILFAIDGEPFAFTVDDAACIVADLTAAMETAKRKGK